MTQGLNRKIYASITIVIRVSSQLMGALIIEVRD